MFIFRARWRLAKFLALALTVTFLGVPQPAQASLAGKTQLFPTWASGDNLLVVDSVGIKKQTPSAIINSSVSFVPYFILGTNQGTVGSVDTSTAFAFIAYTIKDPSGKTIQNTPASQEILATGTLNRQSDRRTVQSTTTNGQSVTFYPEQVGNYSVTVWHDYNNDLKQDANETSATAFFMVYQNTSLSLTVNNYGSYMIGKMTDGSYGFLTKICINNFQNVSGAQFTSGFSISTDSSTEIFDYISQWNNGNFEMLDVANPTSYTLMSDNFGENGCAYINHFNSASTPGIVKMIITGLSGDLKDVSYSTSFLYYSESIYPETLSASRVVTNTSNLVSTYSSSNSATAAAAGANGTNFEIGVPVSSSVALNISTTANPVDPGNKGSAVLMRVVDTDGAITGLKGASYMVGALSSASAATPYTVSPNTFYATLARNQSYMIYVQGNNSLLGGNVKGTVAIQVKPQERFPKYILGSPTVLRGNAGESLTTYLQVKDQFGYLIPNAVIIPVVSGRNSNQDNLKAYQTDSYGRIPWTLKDNPVNSNLLSDFVGGKDPNGQTLLGAGLTIYYGPLPQVATIKVTGAASEDKINEFTKSFIDTSYAGASNSTVKMTATLFDGNGNTMPAGIKVNWSTKGLEGKTFIPTDSATGVNYSSTFTDATGSAITYVYSWGTGDVEVFANVDTATVTTPGKIHFVNSPNDARIVSATSSLGVVKARVEDRYGNSVPGVSLTIDHISGTGHIPNQGNGRVIGTTDSNGNLEFAVTGGEVTFEISTTSIGFGQTSSEAGYVNGVTVSTSTAGGNLTPAGVAKVKIVVKSRDLNAEAIAANKLATDAAEKAIEAGNLAAEKADLATLKVKEVQDSLLEISNSITNFVTETRLKITELSKVILKISKKVR